MNAATLAIKIISDAAGAAKGFREVEGAGDRMGRRLQTASNVAKVGVLALGAAMVSGARAAAEDEKSQALLANTMTKAAGATGAQIAATEKFIDSTARASGVADDQLRPALANLVRATGDVSTAQGALAVAMDVSASTGKPLESVSAALSKAYAGNTTSLLRLVPGLDKATVASGDMNAIMKELARTTGGAAAVAAETTEGKIARMTVAFNEAKEALGVALLPALTQLATSLASVALFVQNNQTTVTILVAVLGGLAVATILVNSAYKVYVAMQIAATAAGNLHVLTALRLTAALIAHTVATAAVRVATLAWTAAQWLLNAALLANPLGLFIAAIALVVAGLILAYQKSETFRTIVQAVCKAVIGAFQPVISKVQELWRWITNGESVAQHARDIIVGAFRAMTAPIRAVIAAVKDLINWISKIDMPDISIGMGWGAGGRGGPGGLAESTFGGRGGPGGVPFMARMGSRQAGVLHVHFHGPVDADASARAIEDLLRGRGYRMGATIG